ncbi:MAG: carboxypeptidase Q [Saprospiraceae bacterium]|jgi:carboxypeptidase Q
MIKKLSLTLFLSSLFLISLNAQVDTEDKDAFFIRKIYDTALTEGRCYPWLMSLTNNIGGRLAGSPQAAAAVEYTYQMLDTLGLDKVWKQPCIVPHWVRGDKEVVRIASSIMGSLDMNALALGNSVGTGENGIAAEVIEVQGLEEVENMNPADVKGKIIFYNRPMDPKQIKTMSAYGGAVDQRGSGASVASKMGAIGVLVRSMTTRLDDIPHTGGLWYQDGVKPIPAVAISTNDAERLSNLLKQDKVTVYMQTTCGMLSPKPSFNVIGEIKGSEFPDEIILVGGHLDSWDVGKGAHDDGAGCAHSMDVLQVLKRMNYQPKRTIRCVLFMNEENGLAGGKEYAKVSNEKGEFHMAAIESDSGGFTPRGFSADGMPDIVNGKIKQISQWSWLLESYGLTFEKGGSGADISPLKSQNGILIGFRPDSQRYFDYHHTAIDAPDAVNKRELELGVAAITSLVYLLDKYGLE